jgi:hypothetical protein
LLNYVTTTQYCTHFLFFLFKTQGYTLPNNLDYQEDSCAKRPKEKDIALSNICSLTKKITKSMEVLGKLFFCLKDAKTEFCSNEKCHSLELLTMIKSVSETESKLRESDHPHSLKVSKMANDIMAKCEAIEKKPKRVH